MKRARDWRAKPEAGVTLMELLIAMTLMSLLSVGIVMSLRVGLSAMSKTDTKLMANRRVASVERILEQQISSAMPVTADCQPRGNGPPGRMLFFQGEAQSMRLASTFSLQQGARGVPMILEFQVIPGENGQGVRLVVNEHWYTGSRGAGMFCLGMGADPLTGGPAPLFLPIEVGAGSFVLVDKLAYAPAGALSPARCCSVAAHPDVLPNTAGFLPAKTVTFPLRAMCFVWVLNEGLV
jgi:type II secretory pathway component PulJ